MVFQLFLLEKILVERFFFGDGGMTKGEAIRRMEYAGVSQKSGQLWWRKNLKIISIHYYYYYYYNDKE